MVSTFGKVTAPGASAGQGAERAALSLGQRPRCSRAASLCSAQIPGDYFDRPGVSFFTHRLSDRQRPGSRFRGQLAGRSGDASEKGNGDLGRHLVFGCKVTER